MENVSVKSRLLISPPTILERANSKEKPTLALPAHFLLVSSLLLYNSPPSPSTLRFPPRLGIDSRLQAPYYSTSALFAWAVEPFSRQSRIRRARVIAVLIHHDRDSSHCSSRTIDIEQPFVDN